MLAFEVGRWRRTAKNEPKPYPKTAAGVRYVPIEVSLLPLLRVLRAGAADTDPVECLPPAEDWASTVRVHLQRAKVERGSLFDDTPTQKQITLYDLRATGITWRTLRGDDARVIQRAAGHEKYATTEGYVREAEVFKGRVGDPFPPLPPSLLSGISITKIDHESRNGGKYGVPKGIRTPVTALKGPCPGPG